MKKKIGIITLHYAINFGSFFQAYALVETLNSLGYEANIIDYRDCEIEFENSSRLFNFKYLLENPVKFIRIVFKKLINHNNLRLKQTIYHDGQLRNLHLHHIVNNDFSSLNYEFDQFIVGSDQVWNVNIVKDSITKYLLCDIKKPKFTYASSFGDTAIEKFVSYKKCIHDFDSISIREKESLESFNKLINHKSTYNHIDPSLLLKSENYKQLMDKPENLDESRPIILVIDNYIDKNLKKTINQLSKENNSSIISVFGRKYHDSINVKGITSPFGILGLIEQADFIITTSFHGLAFSIIFEKKFGVYLLGSRSNRIVNLLELLKIKDRLFFDYVDLHNLINETPNYKVMNKILELERFKSLDYLRRNLHE